jgi:two-component system NtrC family response regulator
VIERIGGRRPIAVDTRIVCATHQDLPEMIKAGRFREDLWYRLAEIVVRIPSLAERHGDSVLLAKHFLHRFAREMNPQVKGFSPAALAAIDAWPWPGNVRELENRMKRAVIMADGKLVTAETSTLEGRARELPSTSRPRARRRTARDPPGARPQREQHLNAAKLLGISARRFTISSTIWAPAMKKHQLLLAAALLAPPPPLQRPSGARRRRAYAARRRALAKAAAERGSSS